jgi:uncharacterized protein (TIGR02145 family)
MKTICKILIFALLVVLFFSCKKDRPTIPDITTIAIDSILDKTVISGGNITSDNRGEITARGVCWSTDHNPTTSDGTTSDGTGTGSFKSKPTGLLPITTYYLRAYATNSAGTAYGNELSFKTFAAADKDGNVYNSVTIGSQIWLDENLKTTKFSDGSSIPNVTSDITWANLSTGAFCWLNNDEGTYKATYGGLYNWYSVSTGKLCPNGWHVPSDSEVTVLTDFLGGIEVAGGKMKEVGTAHWTSPNTGATNSSGFTSLAAGQRHTDGTFGDFGLGTGWWTSTPYNELKPWYFSNWYSNIMEGRGNGTLNNVGLSIRCVKN